MSATDVAAVLLGAGVLASLASGCKKDEGQGQLHAQQAALEREAEGLRTTLGKLEKGEPILPEDAVVISVSEDVIKEFLEAQLPFEVAADKFKVKLSEGEALFRGSPAIRMKGSIWPTGHPDLVGEVEVRGALEDIRVEAETGTLRATLALDHVDLLEMAGLEKFIAAGSRNELARTVRKQLESRLPALQIPVKIEQGIDLPTVDDGPVRIRGAKMPLAVAVADVFAGQRVLWVAIKITPGELVRSGKAPASPEAGR